MKNLVPFKGLCLGMISVGASLVVPVAAQESHVSDVHYEALIPAPKELNVVKSKGFTLSLPLDIIVVDTGADAEQLEVLKKNAIMLGEYLAQAMDGKRADMQTYEASWGKVLTAPNADLGVILRLDKAIKNKEGYTLKVRQNQIVISGSTPAGVFYGIQMLRKAVYTAGQTHFDKAALSMMDPYHHTKDVFTPLQMDKVYLESVDIEDAPRFGYRGFMLDLVRHFMPFEDIKKVIDLCALHQLNRLHLHLTDDQGWRLEIKRYPKLTEIGSQRKETVLGRNTDKYDGKPHGGFLTQEQVKDLVQYAQERHITIVPEIDVPGHTLSLLAAYPELGCTGGPYEVGTRWGVFPDVLCVGNPKTIPFIQGVLDEVMDLFPSEYIHIGGDEAVKTRWETCPKCQQLIRRLWLKDKPENPAEHQLQAHFIVQMEQYLNKRGRRLIGWDEILEGRLAPNATVMSWRGVKGGVAAANMGHDVIMTPGTHMYFDHYQGDRKTEPLAIGGMSPVSKVYEFNPIVSGLGKHEGGGESVNVTKSQFSSILKHNMSDKKLVDTREQDSHYLPTSVEMIAKKPTDHVLGAQANLWREYIPTTDYVYYMVLPRMAALAEVVWCEMGRKNWNRFEKAMPYVLRMYEDLGYNFAPHVLQNDGQTAKKEK